MGSARCDSSAHQADGSYATRTPIVGEVRDGVSSQMTYGESQMPPMSSQLSSVATVELSGQLLGDASARRWSSWTPSSATPTS